MSSEKVIRVFNLTDVSTPMLEQFKLVNVTLAVGRVLVSPGEMQETPDDVVTRNGLEHYTTVGAVAVDSLPPAYIVAKEQLPKSPIRSPNPRMVGPSEAVTQLKEVADLVEEKSSKKDVKDSKKV